MLLGSVRVAVLTTLVLAATAPAHATTWVDADVKCPICGTTNQFRQVASYGNYIYSWPSKYQLVFWPQTDGQSLYSCKKCGLSLFMWDFEALTKETANFDA